MTRVSQQVMLAQHDLPALHTCCMDVLHGSHVTRVPTPLSRHTGFRHASAISSPPSLAPQCSLSRLRLSSPSLYTLLKPAEESAEG